MPSKPERFYASYLIQTPLPLDQAAAAMAGETPALRDVHGACVEAVTAMEDVAAPTLPGCGGGIIGHPGGAGAV